VRGCVVEDVDATRDELQYGLRVSTSVSRVQPEPDSTPRREALRSPWRDRRVADRRHPRQRLLRREIPARPCVRDERLPQIGSALAAEVASVADLRPELLGRVSAAARLAERDWMIRAQLEEQRPESDKQQHDARIMSSSTSLSSTAAK